MVVTDPLAPATNTAPTVEQALQYADTLLRYLQAGHTIAELTGMEKRHIDALYQVGYEHYAAGQYNEATLVFARLVMLDGQDKRGFLGIASIMQMKQDYKNAIVNYSVASLRDMDDPYPTFQTAECFLHLGMPDEAREALGHVLAQTKASDPGGYRPRAEALLTLLDRHATAKPAVKGDQS